MYKLKFMLLASVFALAFSAKLAAQEEPGLTKDKIRIGLFAPLSGAALPYGFDPINGARMYYDKINAEGGIYGRKIELVIEDDRCNATDLVAAIKKLVEQDKVFLLNGGACSAAVVGARETVERYKIPYLVLIAAADGVLYPPSKYIYGAIPITQHAVGGSIVAFATEHLKAKNIAYINHDDAYGAWNLEAADFQAKHRGVKISTQSISPTLVDMTAPMLKLKATNPDVLLIMTYARPATLIVKKAFEMGFTKPIVLSTSSIADLKQLADNVGNMEAFKNVYVQDVLADVPGGPKIKWIYDLYKKTYPELAAKPGYPQPYMPYGVQSAMTVVKVLQLAGPNPTREKFLNAMSNLKYDSGLMAGPIEFSDTNHAAQESAIFLKFDGTNQTLIAGTFKSLWKYTPK